MPITLSCACGKTLRVADEHAGRRVKCPACNAIIAPPVPEPQHEVVEDEPRRVPSAKPVAKSAHEEDEDDEVIFGMKRAEKLPGPPKKKPRFRKRAGRDDGDRPGRRSRHSRETSAELWRQYRYIIGGILMLPAGLGLIMMAFNSDSRARFRAGVLGVTLAIGGLVMLVQGISGNMPDPE